MKPRVFGWVRRHPWWSTALVVLTGLVLFNVVAYRHARAMLTFTSGDKTPPPEGLTAWGKAKALAFGVTVPRPALGRVPSDIGLSAETVRFTADDGVNLEAWLIAPPGAKGTVVLFHGYAACRSTLLPEAEAVVALGCTAFVVDFRGCGGSDGSACTLGYDEARDVVAALRYARGRNLPGPVMLFGQSMGGAAVLRAVAVHGADPDGVIVESVFARTLTTVRNRFALMGVPSFPGAEVLVFWGGVHGGFDGFSHDPAEYARVCRVPALVLHGGADRNATPAEGQAIFDKLAGRKELVIFDSVGHTSLCAADRARWVSTIECFTESARK